jgi:U4/U6.U5 tri-snRNP-associated protein 2
VKNLDLSSIYSPEGQARACPSAESLPSLPVGQLRELIKAWGSVPQKKELDVCCEKADLLRLASSVCEESAGRSTSKYNLLANICRESAQGSALQGLSVGAGTESNNAKVAADTAVKVTASAALPPCKVHLQNRATRQWFELQDLHVTEIMPQLIALSESNILIYSNE